MQKQDGHATVHGSVPPIASDQFSTIGKISLWATIFGIVSPVAVRA